MTSESCHEMELLIQADLDGELTPAEAARVAAYLDSCPDGKTMQDSLSSNSARLRQASLYFFAPQSLRDAVQARIAVELPQVMPVKAVPKRRWWLPRIDLAFGAPFATGFALAACVAFAVVMPGIGNNMAESIITDHIRALQPGHLMDVVSTDQHTVKPWFDGRLAFSPPVKDFKSEGFPLAGGRLDYLDGHAVAALAYHSRQHIISLFIWPSSSDIDHGPTRGSHSGYNFIRWSSDGMVFWAVSDLNANELAGFVRLWRGF